MLNHPDDVGSYKSCDHCAYFGWVDKGPSVRMGAVPFPMPSVKALDQDWGLTCCWGHQYSAEMKMKDHGVS